MTKSPKMKALKFMLDVSKARPCDGCGERRPTDEIHYTARRDSTDSFSLRARPQCGHRRMFEDIANMDLLCTSCRAERDGLKRAAKKAKRLELIRELDIRRKNKYH